MSDVLRRRRFIQSLLEGVADPLEIDRLIEAADCGNGDGGFQGSNTCAKGDGKQFRARKKAKGKKPGPKPRKKSTKKKTTRKKATKKKASPKKKTSTKKKTVSQKDTEQKPARPLTSSGRRNMQRLGNQIPMSQKALAAGETGTMTQTRFKKTFSANRKAPSGVDQEGVDLFFADSIDNHEGTITGKIRGNKMNREKIVDKVGVMQSTLNDLVDDGMDKKTAKFISKEIEKFGVRMLRKEKMYRVSNEVNKEIAAMDKKRRKQAEKEDALWPS